jgi:hypothetical protein
VPNIRKMMSAKAAWARLSAECRTLREALQQLVTLSRARRTLPAREVEDIAAEALEKTERDQAA